MEQPPKASAIVFFSRNNSFLDLNKATCALGCKTELSELFLKPDIDQGLCIKFWICLLHQGSWPRSQVGLKSSLGSAQYVPCESEALPVDLGSNSEGR